MKNEIIPFEYKDIELHPVVDENGTVLFYGRAAAEALGYKRPNDALRQHCKGAAIYRPLETEGGVQQVRYITEGDLYRLIASSKLPSAVEFERWVFDEVIPTVLRHGGYLTPQKVEEALLNPDVLIRLATELKEERAKRLELEAAREADAPKVLFADAVAASKTSILVGELAKILKGNGIEVGQNRLFKELRERGYLIKRKGTDWNMPTQRSMELGLFEIKETAVTHSDGHVTVNKTPKVTGKGQAYFVELFLSESYWEAA